MTNGAKSLLEPFGKKGLRCGRKNDVL